MPTGLLVAALADGTQAVLVRGRSVLVAGMLLVRRDVAGSSDRTTSALDTRADVVPRRAGR